ncbi:MAG TPA: hypothetical protein VGJ21_26110 [Terracidiphilus sp.]
MPNPLPGLFCVILQPMKPVIPHVDNRPMGFDVMFLSMNESAAVPRGALARAVLTTAFAA